MNNKKDYSTVISNSKALIPRLGQVCQETDYEDKGILYSEILFIAACLHNKNINRILESGRARGQGTLLLAKVFPKTKIVSLEYDKDSDDVGVANKRLEGYKNVKMDFGDSIKLLPKIAEFGDVAIIDGPKMFVALRLAFKLLSANKVQHVFIHDLPPTDKCRQFLNRFFKEAIFSDYKELAKVTSVVDAKVSDMIPLENQLEGFPGQYGYGFSLGYLPFNSTRRYTFFYYFSYLYDLFSSEKGILFRIARKIKHQIKAI
jgi:hypothetical protein